MLKLHEVVREQGTGVLVARQDTIHYLDLS